MVLRWTIMMETSVDAAAANGYDNCNWHILPDPS
jgi:hypothetical protein